MPCKRGHVTDLRTSQGWCRLCKRESGRQWYWLHRDVMLAGANLYNSLHREEKLLYAKNYFQLNGRTINKDIADYKRRSINRLAAGSFTLQDLAVQLEKQKNLCNGCSINILNSYTIDHIIALSRGGSNWPSNIQLLCLSCNCSKQDLTMEEWDQRRSRNALG